MTCQWFRTSPTLIQCWTRIAISDRPQESHQQQLEIYMFIKEADCKLPGCHVHSLSLFTNMEEENVVCVWWWWWWWWGGVRQKKRLEIKRKVTGWRIPQSKGTEYIQRSVKGPWDSARLSFFQTRAAWAPENKLIVNGPMKWKEGKRRKENRKLWGGHFVQLLKND